MAQDKITEVFDIQAIESNIAKAIASVKASLPELERLGQSIKSNMTIGGASNNTAAANAAMADFTKNVKEYTEAVKAATTARVTLSNVSDQDAAKQKVNATSLNKQLKEEVVLTSNLTSAYEKLNAQHKQAIKAYQDAAAAGKLSAQQLLAMKDSANKLGDQLVKIDSAVGNYRRNVGNYSSAWNGLGMSIQQVAREMPNFAQSMQLGFLAISNNLPILADELTRAKEKIAALKAEGKDAPSLFSQIASSVFSWQTAMVLGITLLTKYGAELSDMIVKLVSGTSDAVKAQEILNKTYRDQAITDAIANVKQLGVDIELAKNKTIDKNRVLKEYNDTIGKVAGEVKTWNELEQAYIDNSGKYIQFTLLRSAANYAFEESAKKSVDALINAQKTVAASSKINPTSGSPIPFIQALFFGTSTKNAQEEADSLFNIAKDLRARAAKIYDVNDPIITKEKAAAKNKSGKMNEKKVVEDVIDMYDLLLKQMNDFELAEQEVRSRSLAYLRTQLEAGVISVSQYEKQKQDIIKKSEEYILAEQIKFLSKSLNKFGLNEEDTAKVLELWQNKRIDLHKKTTEAEESELKVRVGHRKRFDQINQQKEDDAAQELKRRKEEEARLIQQLAQETANFIFTLLDAQTQKEEEALQKRKDLLTEEYDLKNQAVENASISEEERVARKMVLAAEEEEQQKQIDNEIRKIKRKQAIYDKAQALVTIAINTAIAASNPTNLALGGIITPLIVALGAAQAAVVLATPLPEYAKGKKASDSYEGMAIAGEKGTEMRIDKDGNLQLLDKPTLIHTKRGDTILSNAQLKSGELGNHIKTDKEKANYDELIKAYSYHTDRTIKAIKNSPSNVIIDNSNYNLSLKRARV